MKRTWRLWCEACAACGRELGTDHRLGEVLLFGEQRHDLAVSPATGTAATELPVEGRLELELPAYGVTGCGGSPLSRQPRPGGGSTSGPDAP